MDDAMKVCMTECCGQFLVFLKDYMDVVAKEQQESRIKTLHYLSIQPLRVGIRMNKLMFRVQVMEDTFYLGKRDIVEYYYPDAFQKRYNDNAAQLYQETRKKMIRMQPYEWSEVRNQYAKKYITWVYLMIQDSVPFIVECLEKSNVKISEDFKILFGEYMDRAVLLYPRGEKL